MLSKMEWRQVPRSYSEKGSRCIMYILDCPSETDLCSLRFRVEDLKDPLIGNLVFAREFGDTFTIGVPGAYLLVPFQFGEVFREHRLGGRGIP